MKTMTAFEFITSSRKRKESWKTVIIVAGVKCLVVGYDLLCQGLHEVYIVVKEKGSIKSAIHIPEIHVCNEKDKMEKLFGKMLEGVVV